MRLAFITSSFPPYTSGVAVNAATITSGLAEKMHNIGVFIPDYDHAEIRKSLMVSPKVKLFSLLSIINPLKKSHRLLLFSHKLLIAHLKSFSPDIIHIQEPNFFLFPPVRKFASSHNIPLVSAHHFPPEFITNQLPSFFRTQIFNNMIVKSVVKLYNQSDLVITPTLAMKKLLYDHGLKTPVSIISNGVDTKNFSPKKNKPNPTVPVVLYLGRIDFDKNLNTLIQAAKFIKTPCEIWLAGSGKAVSYLKSLSQSLSLINVRFLGYIEEKNKVDIYHRASVFAMPSTAEAQSIVSLEAAACGLPLVLANAQALPELIDKRYPNGALFNPNDPIDLAVKIDSLLTQSDQLAIFARNSRRLALTHDIKNIIKQYEKAYLSMI